MVFTRGELWASKYVEKSCWEPMPYGVGVRACVAWLREAWKSYWNWKLNFKCASEANKLFFINFPQERIEYTKKKKSALMLPFENVEKKYFIFISLLACIRGKTNNAGIISPARLKELFKVFKVLLFKCLNIWEGICSGINYKR